MEPVSISQGICLHQGIVKPYCTREREYVCHYNTRWGLGILSWCVVSNNSR